MKGPQDAVGLNDAYWTKMGMKLSLEIIGQLAGEAIRHSRPFKHEATAECGCDMRVTHDGGRATIIVIDHEPKTCMIGRDG